MDTRQLEYFLTLCEQEHMSATADMLGISQPALSKSIASLERELGTRLFDRTGNSVKLNDNGRAFAVHARRSLDEIQFGIYNINQSRYDTLGEIRIACHAFADCISDCVLEYMELNPKVRVSIIQSPDYAQKLSQDLDFLLATQGEVLSTEEGKQVWFPRKLFDEQHKVLISPRYREYPAEVTELSMDDLKDDFFVITPDISYYYTDIAWKLCRASGFSPRILCTTEDFMTKLRFVDAGKAICILPESNLRMAQKLSPDVRSFYIRDLNTNRSIYLMRHKKSQMSEVALDFWDFVEDYYVTEGDVL